MLIYTDRLKIRVVRNEPSAVCVFIQFELLERIFAVDIGYNKIAVLGLQTAVHYHDVAIQNPRVDSANSNANSACSESVMSISLLTYAFAAKGDGVA